MLALMGLFGLVAAGFAADAVMNPTAADKDGSPDTGANGGADGADPRAGMDTVPAGTALTLGEVQATQLALADSFADEGAAISDDLPDDPDPPIRQMGTAEGDILNGGNGNDTLMAGAGRDALAGSGGDDLLWGGSGEDALDGGAGNDVLNGRADDDVITAGGGNDTLRGGVGDDRLAGQSGDDLMSGGLGDDVLMGGEGNDTARGGAGDDWLDGGWGDDALSGGAGDDTVDGGAGNDTLNAGTGTDFLNGGAGDDVLRLTPGTMASGGEGADRFELTQGSAEVGAATVSDYDPATDQLVVMLEPWGDGQPPEVSVQDDGEDALILVDGQIVARVLGASGLPVDRLVLQEV